MFRCFIAIDIHENPALRGFLEELRGLGKSLKVVGPQNLHLTLRFLGDVPESSIDAIEGAMRECVSGIEPFTAVLSGAGAFPNANRPRVVWIGMEGEPLKQMASQLNGALAQLGFPPDRHGFSPHVTVARVKGPQQREALQRLLARERGKEFGVLDVPEIRLKRSTLTPTGPIYETLRTVGLS